ncbi:MAG: 1-deoxy-D-xylulose-5-phosphate reductoisomerase [Clostridia bacterium]|nr:1-deoxy-D-xylulose-5-phosphate reductoisomerase [Clostridia bacterium]
MKKLVLLGSTGSIGCQTLEVAEAAGYEVIGLAAGRQIEPLEQQIRRFHPKTVAVYDEQAARDLTVRVADLSVTVLSGMEGLCQLAAMPEADMVLNSVVGMVGLLPTLAAVKAGHDVALANKETLVAGGEFVMNAVKKHGVRLLPVDSEHSAIFQCLQGLPDPSMLRRLILTASGGPFFGYTKDQLRQVTPKQALKHPNWSMGAKITIDSVSMMNKGLEIIEARWLFDKPADEIDVVVHRESIIHSLIECVDGAVLAQLGEPDMRVPIQYALTYPARTPSPVKPLDLAAWNKLSFFAPDDDTFPAMQLCREAITRGGAYPAAINAVNEQAVSLFLQEKIPFMRITELVAETLEKKIPVPSSVEDILTVDREMRATVLK